MVANGNHAIRDGGTPVPAGAHKLVARAPGYQPREIEIPAERGADYKLEVKLERVVVAAPPVVVPPPPEGGIFTTRRKIALVVGGAGVVALGTGMVLGLQAGGLDDDTYQLCEAPAVPCEDFAEANDLNRRARSRADQANLAYGIAGGAAIAAAVLWLTGAPESRSRVAVTPRLGATAGLALAVRF